LGLATQILRSAHHLKIVFKIVISKFFQRFKSYEQTQELRTDSQIDDGQMEAIPINPSLLCRGSQCFM
jgi:hypothetical protein